MKTLILLIMVLIIASVSNAQNTNITDVNFKNALISAGVDTSGDGEISYAEAEAIISLHVSGMNISDMTGIEAFVNLDSLDCSFNQLTNLDVSNCSVLKTLNCKTNQLTSLDISGCTALTWLDCGCAALSSRNQLTTLDVSNNIALEYLNCSSNQLASLDVSNCSVLKTLICCANGLTNLDISGCTSLTTLNCGTSSKFCWGNHLTNLDVSNNIALTSLSCAGNQLTTLDVSKNTSLTHLNCSNNNLTSLNVSDNPVLEYLCCSNNQLISLDLYNNSELDHLNLSYMPTLYEVCVWEIPFPPALVDLEIEGSSNVYFTTDCSATALNSYEDELGVSIYPNPSNDIINIEIENPNNATIEIYNVSGKLVFSKAVNSKPEKIDVSGLSEGIYIIKVMQDRAINFGKAVVR